MSTLMVLIMEHMNLNLMEIGYMYTIPEKRMERSLHIPLIMSFLTMKAIHTETQLAFDAS
jgi:hypothetical protein